MTVSYFFVTDYCPDRKGPLTQADIVSEYLRVPLTHEEILSEYLRNKHQEEQRTFFGKIVNMWQPSVSMWQPSTDTYCTSAGLRITNAANQIMVLVQLFDCFYLRTNVFDHSSIYKVLFNQSKAHVKHLLSV